MPRTHHNSCREAVGPSCTNAYMLPHATVGEGGGAGREIENRQRKAQQILGETQSQTETFTENRPSKCPHTNAEKGLGCVAQP